MKGICFIEPLFNKVVKREKTQTRRMIGQQPGMGEYYEEIDKGEFAYMSHGGMSGPYYPKYKISEIVYLKEPFVCYQETHQELMTNASGLEIAYKYGNNLSIENITGNSELKWGNKLFMPERYARYFIEITAVRVERLQDISAEDCMKEGIEMVHRAGHAGENNPSGLCFDISQKWDYQYSCSESAPWKAYAALINKINGNGTWEKNPWVWVYDFELINK